MPNIKYKEFLRKHTTEDIINKMDEDYVITLKGKEVSRHKSENDARSAWHKLRQKHGNDVKVVKEDAPVNAVGTGANVSLPPAVEPGVKKSKKKDERDPLMFAKPFKRKIKESDDNNSTLLKGILNTIEKLEEKIDEKNGIVKEEITVEVEEDYVSFREKYNAKKF